MSVGYNLEGIQSPRMTRFMDRLADASPEIAEIKATLRRDFPQFADIEIPTRLVSSVTLSTMHGCPPDEIERIARYLLEERGLHTVVKMNPTLLGKPDVLDILHNQLGFTEIEIPDSVFEKDLKYDRALTLIRTLKEVAAARELTFGVKLSNTLAMHNHRGVMPGDEMYMSGRALYPITMNLYARLMDEFAGDLRVSYSAGVDAENVSTILACGARPITGCTDLLKPGGYGRMVQWLESIETAMQGQGATDLDAFAANRLANVRWAAAEALENPRYKKHAFPYGLPKVKSSLGMWDCIVSPCVEACAVEQDVPEYAWYIAHGDYDRALEVVLARNPLPGVTGYVCNHLCQTKCTQNDYEEPVAIRALKRIAAEKGDASYVARRAGEDRAPRRRDRVRPGRAFGGGVPGAQRREGDDLRGARYAGRDVARRAAVPVAVAHHPGRRGSHHGAGRRVEAEPPDHRTAGSVAGRGFRCGVHRQRVPARHTAAHRRDRGAGRDARAPPARPLASRRARGTGAQGCRDRRRRHRHGRRRARRNASPVNRRPSCIGGRATRCPPPKRSWKARSKRATSCWNWRRRCACYAKMA